MAAPDPSLSSPHGTTCAPYMERAMRMLGDEWTLKIIYALFSGTRRFGELQAALGSVSPKTVSQRLKQLEERGFVERHAFAEIPPRVEYSLTEKGWALVDIMQALQQFSERYFSDEDPEHAAAPAGGDELPAG